MTLTLEATPLWAADREFNIPIPGKWRKKCGRRRKLERRRGRTFTARTWRQIRAQNSSICDELCTCCCDGGAPGGDCCTPLKELETDGTMSLSGPCISGCSSITMSWDGPGDFWESASLIDCGDLDFASGFTADCVDPGTANGNWTIGFDGFGDDCKLVAASEDTTSVTCTTSTVTVEGTTATSGTCPDCGGGGDVDWEFTIP